MAIKYTKKGQPYRIMANGRARFIKKGRRARRSHGVAGVTRTQTSGRRRRGVSSMPRRKGYHRSGSRGFGVRKLFSGISPATVGQGVIAGNSTGTNLAGYLCAYATAGMGGVLGCFLSPLSKQPIAQGFNVSISNLHG